MDKEYLTALDVATYLRLNVDTVKRWIKRGVFKTTRGTKNLILIHRDEVKKILKQE